MSFIHDFLKPRDQVENMLMGGSWHGSGIALSRSQFIRFAKFFKLDKEVKSGRMKVIKYNNIPVWQK